MTFQIPILPLIIGAVFNMILGMLWYSNVLFAKRWMKEAGITEEQVNDNTGMGKVYLLTTLFALITSYVIGFLIINMNITTILGGILVAILIWLGMSLPMVIKNWGFEGRSIPLGLINHGYELVVYLVVSILYVIL